MFARVGNLFLSNQLSLIVIGLMAFLPFLITKHQLPIASFYGEWVAASLGVLALLPLLKRESWQPLEIPNISLVFLGLLVLLFIQWQLGMLQSTHYALMAASYLLWAFFLAILGAYLRRQLGWERLVTTLAWFVLVSGLLNGAFVLLQVAVQNGVALPFMPKLRGYGAIAQANQFANHTALALVSLLYLSTKYSFKKPLILLAGLLFLTMFAFSGSRSTWLYLVAIFSVALLFRFFVVKQSATRLRADNQQSRTLIRYALWLLPLYILVQFLIFLIFDSAGGAALQRTGALPTERLLDESVAVSGLTIRLHLWQESWQLFMQSPWLGIGLGQMRWETFMHLNPETAKGMPQMYEHAHNLLVHLLVEQGVFAVILVVLALFAWLRAFAWQHITLSTWWLLGMLGVIGIHSMLEYPLWYAYFLGIAAFLLGAGEEKCSQVRLTLSGRALVVTVMVLACFHLGTTLHAQQKLNHWMYQAVRGDVSQTEWPAMRDDLAWVQHKSLLSPYATVLYANLLSLDQEHLEGKLAMTEAAMRFMPNRPVAYRHGLLLALNGEREAAVEHLRRTLVSFPGGVTKQVQALPFEYWQLFIELLQETRPDVSILPSANQESSVVETKN